MQALSTALVIVGAEGVGKTLLLDRLRLAATHRTQVLVPVVEGAALDPLLADFRSHDLVAVDDIERWDQKHLGAQVNLLLCAAREHRKRVVLVIRHRDALARAEIYFGEPTVYVEIEARGGPVKVFYRGTCVTYAFPEAADL